MAIPKGSFHVRSISLPSTSYPIDASIEDHLRELSASQAGPSSSSTICQNLSSLKHLYDHLNDSIHLPNNQQVLSNKFHREVVESVLEGSLALLDVSTCAKDALSQMKESILDLQSALRRGSEDEGIQSYSIARKKISKMVNKCLTNVKKTTKVCPETDAMIVTMLKDAEVISVSTMKSLMSYVMGKNVVVPQTRGWSLVAKLIKSKNVCNDSEDVTEVEAVDRYLSAHSEKQSGTETRMAVMKQFETMEMAINEIENGLDSVSRCLDKTRVSLLNVLNH